MIDVCREVIVGSNEVLATNATGTVGGAGRHEDHIDDAAAGVVGLRELVIINEGPDKIFDVVVDVGAWRCGTGNDYGATQIATADAVLAQAGHPRAAENCLNGGEDGAGRGAGSGLIPGATPEDELHGQAASNRAATVRDINRQGTDWRKQKVGG